MSELRVFVQNRILQLCMTGLLVVALAHWPYGFYTFLRIAVSISSGVLAWKSAQTRQTFWVIVMAGIAILFNPIIPIYLKRDQWAVIDVIAAALFIFCPVSGRKTRKLP